VKWTTCVALAGALPLTVVMTDGPTAPNGRHYLSQPLVTSIYTADPSAHVFKGKIYVYPSHDVPTDIPDDDLGSEYAMHDYRVLKMDGIGAPVTIGPVALDVKDVPWASKQLWAPDAAYRRGRNSNAEVTLFVAARKIKIVTSAKLSPSQLRAASASIPQSSRIPTARATCTLAASGADS
jgi:hypothetical protein